MQVVLVVAHVYGADERNEQAAELLQQSDVSRTLTSTLDAAMQGRNAYSKEELLLGLQVGNHQGHNQGYETCPEWFPKQLQLDS